MSDMDLGKEAVRLITCPTCGALPGDPCLTSSGRKLTDNGHPCHTFRVEPIRVVWSDGYLAADELAMSWRQRALQLNSDHIALRGRVLAALDPGGPGE